MFKWEKGRLSTGSYQKMKIFQITFPFAMDCYLIKMKSGDTIPLHIDTNPDGEHHRINFVLAQADAGGIFHTPDRGYTDSRINYFRPDLELHGVTKVLSGSRYVLSFGWLRNKLNNTFQPV